MGVCARVFMLISYLERERERERFVQVAFLDAHLFPEMQCSCINIDSGQNHVALPLQLKMFRDELKLKLARINLQHKVVTQKWLLAWLPAIRTKGNGF